MFGRRSKRAASGATDGRSRGLRLTERLLPIFGPAQVGSSTAPVRPATDAEVTRDAELRTRLTRVVGPDGTSYVVSTPVPPAQPASSEAAPALPALPDEHEEPEPS